MYMNMGILECNCLNFLKSIHSQYCLGLRKLKRFLLDDFYLRY